MQQGSGARFGAGFHFGWRPSAVATVVFVLASLASGPAAFGLGLPVVGSAEMPTRLSYGASASQQSSPASATWGGITLVAWSDSHLRIALPPTMH